MLKDCLKNITIQDLVSSKQISIRSSNCCFNARFESLYDIISYYESGNSFLNIRNAGRLTAQELRILGSSIFYNDRVDEITFNEFELTGELINIIKLNINKWSESANDIIEERVNKVNISDHTPKTEGKLFVESLDSKYNYLIKNKYDELLSLLSVRTRNAFVKLATTDFLEFYAFCKQDDLLHIPNIGITSIPEILEFRSKLLHYIEEIRLSDDLCIIFQNSIAKYKFSDSINDEYIYAFYKEKKHLPMFWILEQYLKNDKSREIEILIESFKIFKNQQLCALDGLSLKYNLSRERVRQIRNNVFYKVFEISDEIIESKKNDFAKYSILLQNKDGWTYLLGILYDEGEFFYQESFEIQNCLKEEQCNFSVEFALQIIAYVFREKYTLLGGIDVSNKSKIWDNTFLIKREYSDIFDFEKMKVEFSNILMNNEIDYLLNIEDYLANSQCWIKYDYNKTDSLVSIVRDLLLYEFHLYSEDIDGDIKLPANKERKPIDVIYEILQQTGRPMHIDEIFEEFKVILPEHKYTEAAQLRPYLQRHEAISYRNRKSVYTLKEWEHIKTGTIRDAIVEFLLEKDLPQKANDITEYVLQYFPETNISSVRTTMFNDTQKRFSFFNDNIFGLKDKEYPLEYELSEQQEVLRKSFEQRILDLELFIVEEGHFPFASSENSKESSLGRWWYRIINNKQQINDKQQDEVNRVKAQYAEYDTDKTTYDWNLNYNKLKIFLLENRRIPSARGGEKFLYGWFRRVKEDFENYDLTEEQRQKYINLAKLI